MRITFIYRHKIKTQSDSDSLKTAFDFSIVAIINVFCYGLVFSSSLLLLLSMSRLFYSLWLFCACRLFHSNSVHFPSFDSRCFRNVRVNVRGDVRVFVFHFYSVFFLRLHFGAV